jgi:hypothetical protein
MCWSATASVAMVAVGGAATVATWARGEPPAIWLAIAWFTLMEGLQAAGYAVVDRCSDPANATITWASYLHIAFQPLFINAFAMAIAPWPISPAMRRGVYAVTALCTGLLLLKAVPLEAFGACTPGSPLCGVAACLTSGEWHIAWLLPLNGFLNETGPFPPFPAYFFAVFVLPLVYGAWRFVVFHAVAGPVAASFLTSNPSEMPAIWCLFSIGIVLIALSPPIRYGLMGAPRLGAA